MPHRHRSVSSFVRTLAREALSPNRQRRRKLSPERKAQIDVVSDILEQANTLLENDQYHPAGRELVHAAKGQLEFDKQTVIDGNVRRNRPRQQNAQHMEGRADKRRAVATIHRARNSRVNSAISS